MPISPNTQISPIMLIQSIETGEDGWWELVDILNMRDFRTPHPAVNNDLKLKYLPWKVIVAQE